MSTTPLTRPVIFPQLERLRLAFDLVRTLETEVPAQCISAFFYIAARKCVYKMEMEEALCFSSASASRVTDYLCETNRLGLPGLGLVEKFVMPKDKKRVQIRLTQKGLDLLAKCSKIKY